MNEQAIIDNAPEGWTHYIKAPSAWDYFKFSDKENYPYIWSEQYNQWEQFDSFEFCLITYHDIRSRSDIERIVELEKVNEKLKLEAQIHAGEDDTHKAIVFEIYKALGIQGKADWNGAAPVEEAVRHIKADAIEEAADNVDDYSVNGEWWVNYEGLTDYANQLRNEVNDDTTN